MLAQRSSNRVAVGRKAFRGASTRSWRRAVGHRMGCRYFEAASGRVVPRGVVDASGADEVKTVAERA